MAQITAPTPDEIYKASKLSPAHFETEATGSLTDSDITAMIEAEILPDIVGDINLAVDEAAAPLDFPFDAGTLATAYPSKSQQSSEEWIDAQQGRFRRIITWLALAELYSRVASLEDAYDKKAEMYRGWADKLLKEALASIRAIVKLTQSEQDVEEEADIGIAIVNYSPFRLTGL